MIKIICVGHLKEKYLKDAVEDYKKRISKYHKIEIIELKDSNQMLEEKEIINCIKDKEYVILLDVKGKTLDTVELSEKIDNCFVNGISNIDFVIGGSEGVTGEIKKISKESISFSSLTFPHGLFRVILLEQIYRVFKILNNESYHK